MESLVMRCASFRISDFKNGAHVSSLSAMASTEKVLLFCDTFSHEGEEVRVKEASLVQKSSYLTLKDVYFVFSLQGELHVDMVKFSPAVTVQEVRVVPRNVKVHPSINDKIG